jgi:plastocyanin domain-containing protein
MTILLINGLGFLLIIGVLWWFLGSKPAAHKTLTRNNIVDILVREGVYEPGRILVPAETPLTLRFFREDPTPCAEVIEFAAINRSFFLPLNKTIEIKLDPLPRGELEFTCQMGRYRGRLVVE